MSKGQADVGVVAERMKEWRRASKLRQYDVALMAQRAGLPWVRSTVHAIERDVRQVSLREFLYLIQFEDGPFPVTLVPMTDGARDFLYAMTDGEMAVRRKVDAPGETESKAARRLGVSLLDLGIVSRRAWGQTLSAERDERIRSRGLDGGSLRCVQARRGHVTRELLGELRAEFAKW